MDIVTAVEQANLIMKGLTFTKIVAMTNDFKLKAF